MRLLNARTKTLEEFFDDNIPRYAILSHTWGRNEPTYRDFAAVGIRDANVKIDGCCNQALRDGYQYVWIDAICIDKSSSADLSEAINSMYTWHESADVCYAYLADVASDNTTPVSQLADPDTDFCRSKWFTRGWTLQELIAPWRVAFYNFRWLYIMEKRTVAPRTRAFGSMGERQGDWHRALEKITRIPCEVLYGNVPLATISVAARMTWAANRRTTRKEDIAYCLLGIFNINMSMLYGEGTRAFTRLQEEIIRTSDDESIFAWGFKNGNVHRIHDLEAISAENRLLASSPTDFLGCENILTISPGEYWGTSQYMATHYSLTNKGLQIDRPLVILPAPFHTTLVPLNCCPIEPSETCSQILALPLRGGQIFDEAQLFMDSSSCPVLIGSHLIAGDPEKTKIYISASPGTLDAWRHEDIQIQVNIQQASTGLRAKAVYPTWFTSPSMWKRDTTSGVYLSSTSWGTVGEVWMGPPTHALVDLACPNGQRYMVHLVQSYDPMAPNALSFTAGVSKRGSEDTAVEDILDLKREGYFGPEISVASWLASLRGSNLGPEDMAEEEDTAVGEDLHLKEEGDSAPETSQALWPTTSDDGYIRLELSQPRDDLPEFVTFWDHWMLKILVSCEEEAAT